MQLIMAEIESERQENISKTNKKEKKNTEYKAMTDEEILASQRKLSESQFVKVKK